MRSADSSTGIGSAELSAAGIERGKTLLMGSPLTSGQLRAWTTALRRSLGRQLRGDLGDQLALVPSAVEFELGRLALALPTGDRRCAVGRSADDFVEGHLADVAIGEADDDQDRK